MQIDYFPYGVRGRREWNVYLGRWCARVSLGQLALWRDGQLVWTWIAGCGWSFTAQLPMRESCK